VIAVNARLLDDFDAEEASVTVVDGKGRMVQDVPARES
jgi:hypothetical protein